MDNTWEIITNAVGGLIESGNDPVKFSYIFLYMLVAGFLSLTLCFVLSKRDKFWTELDLVTKSAVSFIVGSISYLVVIMGYNLIKVIFLIFTNKYDEDLTLNYSKFIIMVLFSYTIIMSSIKLKKENKKYDELHILNYFQISASISVALFMLPTGLLFIYLSLFILIHQFNPIFLLILVFGIILIYFAYCFFSNSLKHLINKQLPYHYEYFYKKLIRKLSNLTK